MNMTIFNVLERQVTDPNKWNLWLNEKDLNRYLTF